MPHQMSHKKKWMHLSNDEEDSSDEEWEEPEPSTVVFEISTLTTSAYEDSSHPLPVVTRSWVSPDLVRFHSRKSAMAYAQTLVERDVLIDRTLYGIGKNGIRLRPVKPTRKAALEAGTARFLRDGVWVVGQEEMWIEKRRERFNRKCLEGSRDDPPWRTCGHDFLSRRVCWTPRRGRGRRCQPAVGRVIGWISKSDVDSGGRPGFVSSKTGQPADLFHVEFQDYEQDFEEYELNEIWIDDDGEREVNEESLEKKLSSLVNDQENCNDENSDITSQNPGRLVKDRVVPVKTTAATDEDSESNACSPDKSRETVKQNDMAQDIMAKTVSHNAVDSQQSDPSAIAVSETPVCRPASTMNPAMIGAVAQNKNATEQDLASPNTSAVLDTTCTATASSSRLDQKQAANEVDLPVCSSNSTTNFGMIGAVTQDKIATEQDLSLPNTSADLDTTCTAIATGSGLDQKHAANEPDVKQPDQKRLEAIVKSNDTSESSVTVTVKQSTDSNVENGTTKTVTPHDSDASTHEEGKPTTKPKARRSYIEPLPPSTHYRLNPKQIAKCFSACIEHYEKVMFTVKARSLHHELADGFDVLRERGKGRYDMELPQFDTEEYSFLTDPKKAAWMPIIHKILGNDAILVHKGCFLSLPGSETQVYHQDGVHLHKKVQKPCHAVNVFIPLVDYDMSNGPTEFCLGSHYLGHENFVKEMVSNYCVEVLYKHCVNCLHLVLSTLVGLHTFS